jgi:hypothetical protein
VSTHKYVAATVITIVIAAAVTINNWVDDHTELEMLRITNGKPVEIHRESKRRITIGVEFPSLPAQNDAVPGKEGITAK